MKVSQRAFAWAFRDLLSFRWLRGVYLLSVSILRLARRSVVATAMALYVVLWRQPSLYVQRLREGLRTLAKRPDRPETTVAPKAVLRVRRLKPAYLVLAIAVGVAIASGALGYSFWQKTQEREQTEDKIAGARRSIISSQGLSIGDDLQVQLQGAKDRLAAAQAALPEAVEATAFIGGLVKLAEGHRVAIPRIQPRPPREQLIGQHPYLVTSIGLTVQGRTQDLLAFLSALQESPAQTLAIQTAQFSQTAQGANVVVELEIYARSPRPVPPTPTPQAGKTEEKPKGR